MNTKLKKNLFILGASGALSHSVLVYLKNHRHLFDSVTLLDKRDFTEDEFIRLAEIDAEFIKFHIKENNADAFLKLLQKHHPDIVLDLSDAPTELVADVVFTYGKASYICCAFCTDTSCACPLGEAMEEWMAKQRKKLTPSMPHIFFTGMNPGAVSVTAKRTSITSSTAPRFSNWLREAEKPTKSWGRWRRSAPSYYLYFRTSP